MQTGWIYSVGCSVIQHRIVLDEPARFLHKNRTQLALAVIASYASMSHTHTLRDKAPIAVNVCVGVHSYLFELCCIVLCVCLCLTVLAFKLRLYHNKGPVCALPLLLSHPTDMRRAVGRACHTSFTGIKMANPRPLLPPPRSPTENLNALKENIRVITGALLC